jgi:hypothetical protein
MARLAEIRDASKMPGQVAGQATKIIYINPLNVTSVEPIQGGTKISLNDGHDYQTTLDVADVVNIIQSAMGWTN